MDASASTLLLTKISVPAARPRILPRARLMDMLGIDSGADLILVCAPAGYGKTTLLAEWARTEIQKGIAVAWYALDPSDDSPVSFGSYLVAGLMQALGPNCELEQIAQLLRSSPELDLQRILPHVINAVASDGRECMMILDDFQWIGSPSIHSSIAFLLEHLPDSMRLAIGSRSDPPLPLARLRARGKLLEIRADSLNFTRDESARFLNEVMRLELPAEWISVLEDRTEGWIAGLQLAALSLSGRPDPERLISSFSGSHRYLVDYLLEEVLARQPEPVQSFLLSTSILDRMCAPLCDAVVEQASGGAAVLERLDQENLFIVALDAEVRWYRYHHLFRDFLQARLEKTLPERVTALHRAACRWYSREGYRREAVRHALLTRDWEYAANVVEQYGVSMMMQGEASTVYEWCEAFPEAVMRDHPVIGIFQCNAWLIGYRQKNRPKIEERLRQIDQAVSGMEAGPVTRILLGQAATIRVFLEARTLDPAVDPRKQFSIAQKTLGLLSDDDPARSAVALTIGYAQMALHDAQAGFQAMERARELSIPCRNFIGFVDAVFHQARLAHVQGDLRLAESICRQGRIDLDAMLSGSNREFPAAGCLDVASGCLSLERNRLGEAERQLLHGLDLIGWGLDPHFLMAACVGLFRLREVQGRSGEALQYLSRLEDEWPDIKFCTQGLRIMHTLREGTASADNLADADRWTRSFPLPLNGEGILPGMGPLGAAEAYYLAYLARVRVAMATDRNGDALSYLERQLDLASTHGLAQRVIELSVFEALAAQGEGGGRRVWDALERALAAAPEELCVRSFDQGPDSIRLLQAALKRGMHHEKIGRILAEIEADPSDATDRGSGGKLPNPLSDRELEVLHLLARGMSNQEIARKLVITVGTVKSHVNHILEKLNARNRTEAVARARDLGLLRL
ncbi:MAG: AAA family ATPase [Anaerolineales bacterium]|nr:AAA family ATPase [Anaerolineales bacterium]